MFGLNIERRLIAIENELQAQKVATELNYGQLTLPSATPTASWSGAVTNNGGNTNFAALWVLTFTRTDGVEKAPLVDFCWDFSLGKWNYQDLIDGTSITAVTGPDRRADDEVKWQEGVYGVGANFVKWYVGINASTWFYMSSNGTTVSLTTEAVSMVPGTLTIARVI